MSADNRTPSAASPSYRTIVVDPPWPQKAGNGWAQGAAKSGRFFTPSDDLSSRPLPYSTMSLGEIEALPVGDLAALAAHLYVWVTNKYVENVFGIVRSWGFRPSCLLTWAKAPKGLGLGGAYVQTTEHVLFARRGSLAHLRRVDTTWWQWPRQDRGHSAKPEAFLDIVEQVSPGPRLEMFARRNRLGWDTWGNEALAHVELSA